MRAHEGVRRAVVGLALVAWGVLGTAAGFWLAAAAAVARQRERAAQAHETAEIAEQSGQDEGPPAGLPHEPRHHPTG